MSGMNELRSLLSPEEEQVSVVEVQERPPGAFEDALVARMYYHLG